MADFSKEYIEKYDKGGMPFDFSIAEIYEQLKPGFYASIICEGYGFVGILKRQTGESCDCVLLYYDDRGEKPKCDYVPLAELDEYHKKHILHGN